MAHSSKKVTVSLQASHLEGAAMAGRNRKNTWIIIAAGLGFIMAFLAGFSSKLAWLDSLCGGLSSGCRETANFTVFSIPLWLIGAGFYLALSLALYRANRLVLWLVLAAFGVELRLVWLMFSMKALCVYCLANFVVVAFLAAICFEKKRIWQMSTVSLLSLVLSIFILPSAVNSTLATTNTDPGVAAEVAGKVITIEELERPLSSRIYNLQKEIFQLKRNRLDQLIAEILLQKEAEQRGTSVQQYLQETVLNNRVLVSDDEVEQFYLENRANLAGWRGSEQELKRRIRASLQQQKTYKKILAYAATLRSKYKVSDYLEEPPFPTTLVTVGGDPVEGPADAPVTVIEFSDYLCHSCKKHHAVVKKLRKIYEGQVRWVFKDFPLGGREKAMMVAEAARCAADQGKFAQYRDLLFEVEGELTSTTLNDFAEQLGLDKETFTLCRQEHKFKKQILKDIEEGRKAGIEMTPSFIINGRLIPGGPPLERLQEIINKELSSAYSQKR